MSVVTKGQIVDFLDANLREGWQDGLNRWPEEYSKIFNISDSTKAAEKDSYESGFGAAPVKPEGQAAQYDTIIPGISKTYTFPTYALGYEITEEAIEDNLQTPETFAKLPQALANAFMETVEVSSANVFNNGFTTTGFDSVALFATTHPLLTGGTQSNTPSSQADLSVTSLQNAITAFGQFIDERGLHKATFPKQVAVGVANQFVVNELLKSQYKPYTGNNEINELANRDLMPNINHYFTDDDAWFVLADKGDHMLKFIWRVRLGNLRKSTDFDTTNLKHLNRMRFDVGYSHYKGTYGTSGA